MKFDGGALRLHWRTYRYPYILIIVTILLNIALLGELVSDWVRDANYSHGFLVIPVSVLLLWRKRKELTYPADRSRGGLFILGTGLFGLVLGVAASEVFTARISLIMIISGITLYHVGAVNFRKVWFPFVFLIFMVPIPAVIYYSATLPMQLFSSKMTDVVLHVIGVPSVRQGNIIYLPRYTLEVVEACSGLRSLVSLMALSALYGYLTLSGRWRPVVLLLAAIPIAIIINIFRLVLTAIGAYSVSPQFAEGFLHDLAGVAVFAIAFILVVITGSILKWIKKPS